MTIYKPVTDIGRTIAQVLTKDDGIRLDIHDILEKWEPEYIVEMETAKKWGKLENSELFHDIIVKASKFEAVKTAIEEADGDLHAPRNWAYILVQDIKKILEAEA